MYDHATITLPRDGSAPQAIIPIVDGYECQDCKQKTQNRAVMKQHGNKAHDKQRVADEDLYKVVRLQSWFDARRA